MTRSRRIFHTAGIFAGLLGGLWFASAVHAQDGITNPELVARYEQILERAPQTGPSFDRLMQLFGSGEGLDKLDERWAKLSAEPGDKGATYLVLRGLLADQLGRSDDARQHLTAATTARPDDFRGWLALGDAAAHAGKWADGITAYQKGLATRVAGEDRLTLFRKLGQAQQSNLDATGALATWRKMAAEFPDDRFAVEEAAGALLDAEQFEEARGTFQKLVDLAEPNSMAHVQALMRLADVDARQGRTDAAVKGYEAILPQTAEGSWLNRQLRVQIEQLFRRDNDVPGLIAYYRRWTQANPKDVGALLLLSGALNELDRGPEALDTLRAAATLAPDRFEVRENLARRLSETKQFDEAIKVFTALTVDDPTEDRYWEELGEANWQKTQPPTAESKAAALTAWRHPAPPTARAARRWPENAGRPPAR